MTNDNYAADIRAAQRRFDEKTRGLERPLLRLRLLAMANKATGFGPSQIDPIERSWAAQALATLEAQDEMARVEKRHADLERSRDPRQSEADRLLELKALVDEHHALKIKVLAAAEQDHTLAAKEARAAYAERDARAERVTAIRSAAAAQAEATMMDDHPAVKNLAAALVEKKLAI